MPKFVVAKQYSNNDGLGIANVVTAATVEDAIAHYRRDFGVGGTDHALPLADFIKHATPERRQYQVSVQFHATFQVKAASPEEATQLAIDEAQCRHAFGNYNRITTDTPEVVK